MPDKTRCPWCLNSDLETRYHDLEWGRPVYDDQIQFEFLVLESAQAGLSWVTVLKKRENYRLALAGFNPATVAGFGPAQVEGLLNNPGLIRNRKKMEAVVSNARVFLETAAKHGSFSRYLWSFVDGKPITNHWATPAEVPPKTELTETMAREFKRLGFKFLGPIVLYAHLQATGLVNDHLVSCYRHGEVRRPAAEEPFL